MHLKPFHQTLPIRKNANTILKNLSALIINSGVHIKLGRSQDEFE